MSLEPPGPETQPSHGQRWALFPTLPHVTLLSAPAESTSWGHRGGAGLSLQSASNIADLIFKEARHTQSSNKRR